MVCPLADAITSTHARRSCVAPLGLSGYALYLLTLTEIFTLVALGLNFLTGYAGQISLCHAAFFGVGAYATAILTQKAGVPYLLSLFAGALFTTATVVQALSAGAGAGAGGRT